MWPLEFPRRWYCTIGVRQSCRSRICLGRIPRRFRRGIVRGSSRRGLCRRNRTIVCLRNGNGRRYKVSTFMNKNWQGELPSAKNSLFCLDVPAEEVPLAPSSKPSPPSIKAQGLSPQQISPSGHSSSRPFGHSVAHLSAMSPYVAPHHLVPTPALYTGQQIG